MIGTKVRMCPDGCFELAGDRRVWRIVHDECFAPACWVLFEVNAAAERDRVNFLGSYLNLDDALSALVSTAGRDDSIFSVHLLCGSHFLRPGRVPAEHVMAGFGWVHVREIIGHALVPLYRAKTRADARDMIGRSLDPTCRVGQVLLVTERGETYWLVELHARRDDFIEMSRLDEIANEAFSGVDGLVNAYDVMPSSPIVARVANIVPFPSMRVARIAA